MNLNKARGMHFTYTYTRLEADVNLYDCTVGRTCHVKCCGACLPY